MCCSTAQPTETDAMMLKIIESLGKLTPVLHNQKDGYINWNELKSHLIAQSIQDTSNDDYIAAGEENFGIMKYQELERVILTGVCTYEFLLKTHGIATLELLKQSVDQKK